MQPDAGGGPVAVDGGARKPQHLGYFGSRQASEELHLYDLSLSFIDARQLVQGIVQSQELGVSVDRESVQILEGDLASPVTFGRSTFAGVVHKDLTHEPRSDGDEVCAALQSHRLTSQQPKVGLVNESRALQGVIRSFGLEVVVSEPPQLFVDQRDQSLERLLVSLLPVLQKLGDLAGRIFGHGYLGCPFPEKINSIFVRSALVNHL
jgi:hypothetical protein